MPGIDIVIRRLRQLLEINWLIEELNDIIYQRFRPVRAEETPQAPETTPPVGLPLQAPQTTPPVGLPLQATRRCTTQQIDDSETVTEVRRLRESAGRFPIDL
ncbi:uncharacterized protein LOC100572787 [Acyrthosiphon pisum]|uniref:Uncharacterized protein n=1 Tax=Acyrthosiphon pisum TaxID=7029 RepID=A0A8R1W3W0_ACYPI|nr:uncharacterized protein LOC100572787 [Acyrthosiphon pisum]|eukprot:XP_003240423.1 PREDICTED: uncharacterized protein LOC100572787 [Acyrthosiphon pisum]